MAEGYWVVRTYEAGAVGEKTKFFVPGARPEKRNAKKERDAAKKEAQNEYAAIKNAARIINANFGAGDWLIGLDYDKESYARLERCAAEHPEKDGMDAMREAAEHELRLCMRRVKRELGKAGEQLRLFAVTSDMDGDTGEAVRLHHHIIVNAEAKDAFLAKWGRGGVDFEPLREQIDYYRLAEYLLRQVRRVPNAKKSLTSRNLIRPEPKDRIALSEAELRVPKGGKLLHRSEYSPGQAQYIRYMLPREKWKRPGDGGNKSTRDARAGEGVRESPGEVPG